MASTGSTLYRYRWKVRTTPSHRSICLLRASARRTDAPAFTSWPTATVKDANHSRRHGGYMLTGHQGTTLYDAALMAAWTTPRTGDATRGVESIKTRAKRQKRPGAALNEMASWATPQARDWKGSPNSGPADRGVKGPPLNEQALLRGAWRGADWIPCTDGRARPVEPGTFPLAHGIPARVGRLRGYGNAIVPQVAAEVIAAYMDVRGIGRADRIRT